MLGTGICKMTYVTCYNQHIKFYCLYLHIWEIMPKEWCHLPDLVIVCVVESLLQDSRRQGKHWIQKFSCQTLKTLNFFILTCKKHCQTEDALTCKALKISVFCFLQNLLISHENTIEGVYRLHYMWFLSHSVSHMY